MKKVLVFCLFIALTLSCSSDDTSNPEDKITSIKMTIDGVQRNFIVGGTGIDWSAEGYELSLSFYDNTNPIYSGEYFSIALYMGEKGNNVMDGFYYSENPNGSSSNVVGATFINNVSVNSKSRFKATFSGTIQNGSEVITITHGEMNVVYDEPFDI